MSCGSGRSARAASGDGNGVSGAIDIMRLRGEAHTHKTCKSRAIRLYAIRPKTGTPCTLAATYRHRSAVVVFWISILGCAPFHSSIFLHSTRGALVLP